MTTEPQTAPETPPEPAAGPAPPKPLRQEPDGRWLMQEADGSWVDAEITITREDAKALTDKIDGAKRRAELYAKAEAGHAAAAGALLAERDALAVIAAKLGGSEPGTLAAEETQLVATAVGGWLLKFVVDDMHETVLYDRYVTDPMTAAPLVGFGRVLIGRGRMLT